MVAGIPETALALGQEFVLFNHRGHGHLALGGIFDAHHTALALHADALRQRNFGWERQREADERTLLDA